MRVITKQGNGGYQLQSSHQNPPTTSEQAERRWKNFRHKATLSAYLSTEQFGLCAYTELRPDLAEIGTHIEHIEPKSQNPARTFDYQNLVLSSLSDSDLTGRDKKNIFGGHAKLSNYDAALFVSCLQPDCSGYFTYLSTGIVEPSLTLKPNEREKAVYTIELLNLNSPYLVNARKNWLDELDTLIDQHLHDEQELTYLAQVDLMPHSKKACPFFTATRRRYGRIAEQVLAAHAPELL